MSDALNELYRGGGSRGERVAFAKVGDAVEGVVTDVRLSQLPEFGTSRLETWPDGTPRYTPIVSLDTADGPRVVFAQAGRFTALAAALKDRWPSQPPLASVVGSVLRMERIADDGARHVFRASFRTDASAVVERARETIAAPAQRDLQQRFAELFSARWAEVAAAKGWGMTGPGEIARRKVLQVWYSAASLADVSDAAMLGGRGGRWLRDVPLSSLLAEIERMGL